MTDEVPIEGRSLRERAASYEQAIRSEYGSGRSTPTLLASGRRIDDVIDKWGVEIKYSEDFSRSINNPDRHPWPFFTGAPATFVEQARAYAIGFPERLIYITNSFELARVYTREFESIGVKLPFLVVPARSR